ncbi:hypothetical protein [Baekduia alba]|uniref:hypothetical protein n=1 Tax=Baekduia alba TaxID=2997333 RepID=UPI0023422ADB|nr:hypothetical protein [Baekduia alba]
MQLREVSQAVFDQVREALWKANAFEAPLRAVLTADQWDLRALAGAEVPAERLDDIRMGWLEPGGPGPRDIAEVIVGEMRRAGGAGLISIDVLSKPDDARLEEGGVPFARVAGDTVAYLSGETEIGPVEAAWRMTASPVGHVALVTTYRLPEREDPDYDVIAAVAATTTVILDAYDGDGAVVLTRRLA